MLRWILGGCLVLAGMCRVAFWRESLDASWTLCTEVGATREWAIRGRMLRGEGRLGVDYPEIEISPGRWEAFRGRVGVLAGGEPREGSVLVRGRWRCRGTARNPGRMADGGGHFQVPRLVPRGKPLVSPLVGRAEGVRERLERAARVWIGERVSHSGIGALVRAVWFGDMNDLPPGLVETYRELGISHVLALSGQHVVVLALWLAIGVRAFFALLFLLGARPSGLLFSRIIETLPLFAAGVLWVSAGGNAPIARAAAMVFALMLLRMRGFRSSPVQLTATSVAALLVWDPSLVLQRGFLLSFVATYLLVEMTFRRGLRGYVMISLCMPLVMLPTVAFVQASLPLLAIPATLLVSWMWELAWIPLGFFLPFALRVCPPVGSWLMITVEPLWGRFLALHPEVGRFHSSLMVLRPTWLEWLVWQGLMLCVVKLCRNRGRIDASSIAESALKREHILGN